MPRARAEQLADRFKALSAPVRLEIIRLLKAGALCVEALAARLDVTQGAVSQHLRVLRTAGLVKAQRRGCYIHYGLNEQTLGAWKKDIEAILTSRPGGERRCRRLGGGKGRTECVKPKTSTRAKPETGARSRTN